MDVAQSPEPSKRQEEPQRGRRWLVSLLLFLLCIFGYSVLKESGDSSLFHVRVVRQIVYGRSEKILGEGEVNLVPYNLGGDVEEEEAAEGGESSEAELFRKKYAALYDSINASFTPEPGCSMLYNKSKNSCKILRRPKRSKGLYRPDFFILGTRKGGTTSLITYLSKHRFVSAIHIRGRPTDGEVFTSLDTPNRYNARFAAAKYKFVGDSNVQRLVNDAKKLARNGNASRFIVLLRDPIKRCYSQCLMRMRNKPYMFSNLLANLNGVMEEDKQSFLKRMKAAGDVFNVSLPRKMFRSAVNCWYEGLYYVHLKRLLHYIPKESIRIYWSKDFFESPLLVVQDALKFIGLDPDGWDEETVKVKYNAHKAKDQKRQRFTPELVQEMRDIYRPYDLALGNLLGAPVPWLQGD